MTCLQARNMILKPVTVKQRCHLHNDPSKIGLQPLPWQLVDKQKNGGKAQWIDLKLEGRWAWHLIAVRNGLGFILGKAELHTALLSQARSLSLNGIDRFGVCYPQGCYGLLSLLTLQSYSCKVLTLSHVSKQCRASLPGVWWCGLALRLTAGQCSCRWGEGGQSERGSSQHSSTLPAHIRLAWSALSAQLCTIPLGSPNVLNISNVNITLFRGCWVKQFWLPQ